MTQDFYIIDAQKYKVVKLSDFSDFLFFIKNRHNRYASKMKGDKKRCMKI